MKTSFPSFWGTNLPPSHQVIILILGLCLTGLWAWRTGFFWLESPPANLTPQRYFIQISGDVSFPGFYIFLSPPTVQEVWKTTGGQGTLPNGSQVLTSGSKLNIVADCVLTVSTMSGCDLLTFGLKINPNQACAADLEAIPGIGPVLAKRIIEFREVQGPFENIEALLAVKGLGALKLEQIRQHLVLTPSDYSRNCSD